MPEENMEGETRVEKKDTTAEVEELRCLVQEQFKQFVRGAHQMSACALAAIDACSADVTQTTQLLQFLAEQGTDRKCSQESLQIAQSSFEKHLLECKEEEQRHMHSLWGPITTQQQDLQVRLQLANQLQTLRLQVSLLVDVVTGLMWRWRPLHFIIYKQKVREALLWLELLAGPPTA